MRIKKAKQHSNTTYKKEFFTDIFPEGIGLLLVLFTFLSKSLSTISLKMHPALLIKTEPRKKRIKDNISFKNKAIVDEEGKPAHSFFIQKTNETYSVILLTGRRHQIRCHAAHYLSPIQGDTYYGSKIRLHNQKIALTSVGLNFFCQNKRYRVRLMKEDH